jgi:hypothetical protein
MGLFSREQIKIDIECQKLLDFFTLIGLDVNTLPEYDDKEFVCWIENFKVKPTPGKNWSDLNFYVEMKYLTRARGYTDDSKTRLPNARVYKVKFVNGNLEIKGKGSIEQKMVGK